MKISSSLLITLMAFQISCAEEGKFKGATKTGATYSADDQPDPTGKPESKPKPDTVLDDKGNPAKKIELTPETYIPPVDMYWVIDNSGSMKEEIAQVQTNIQKFVDGLSAKTDLRLNILSAKSDGLPLVLDETKFPKDSIYHDHMVNSNDAMFLLSLSLCEKTLDECVANIGGFGGGGFGGFGRVRGGGDNSAVVGVFRKTMREEASRVVVFVTDDDAKIVTSANFFQASGLDKSSTFVYGFAGIKEGCSIARIGESYLASAAETKGEIFDICEPDWSKNFGSLTENVTKAVSNIFTIPMAAKKILSVKIGDKVLSPADYTFAKGRLTINDRSLLTEKKKILVEYE